MRSPWWLAALVCLAACDDGDTAADPADALDASIADAGLSDADLSDADLSDAAPHDAEVSDAAIFDAELADASAPDTDPPDTEPSDTDPPDAALDLVTISGVVRYADRPFDPVEGLLDPEPAPARGVVVQLIRARDSAIILEALTDEAGRYTLSGEAEASKHRLLALALSRHGDFETVVRDRGEGAIYALTSGPALPATFAEAPQDLMAEADDPIAGAMNIADVTWGAFDFISPYVGEASPTLTYRWQRGQPFNCGSCYSRDTISLGGQLEDPDEYDDDIILHEFGHYFVDHFSHDDSPGGSHRDRQVDPRLAYGEGLAYFFAAMVRGGPDIVDTFLGATRHIDLEAVTQQGEDLPSLYGTTTGTVRGDHREEVVAAVMWDALDPADPSEPFDQIEIGEAGHMAIFVDRFGGDLPPDVGARGTDLADWADVLACAEPVEAVQAIIDDREYPWTVSPDGDCPTSKETEKGHRPAPFTLSKAANGALWALPITGARGPGFDWIYSAEWGKPLSQRPGCAETPCLVHPDPSATEIIIVTDQNELGFTGASWIGPEAAQQMDRGVVQQHPYGVVRTYR